MNNTTGILGTALRNVGRGMISGTRGLIKDNASDYQDAWKTAKGPQSPKALVRGSGDFVKSAYNPIKNFITNPIQRIANKYIYN